MVAYSKTRWNVHHDVVALAQQQPLQYRACSCFLLYTRSQQHRCYLGHQLNPIKAGHSDKIARAPASGGPTNNKRSVHVRMYRDGVRNPISEAAAQQKPLCIDRQQRYVFWTRVVIWPAWSWQLCFEPLRGLLWSGLLPDRSIRNGIHLFLDKLGRCVMIYAGGQCVFQFHSPG
jgi:hypothetical protein